MAGASCAVAIEVDIDAAVSASETAQRMGVERFMDKTSPWISQRSLAVFVGVGTTGGLRAFLDVAIIVAGFGFVKGILDCLVMDGGEGWVRPVEPMSQARDMGHPLFFTQPSKLPVNIPPSRPRCAHENALQYLVFLSEEILCLECFNHRTFPVILGRFYPNPEFVSSGPEK